ncbi:uncharacterized protein PAC_13806 [Phialocephala subalpina]|uniref:Uncharacterized protein n=1 Tax=Phialocephala subalpina TaxID=576137 RepID=A0A1L7XFU0_9HELO|nr:uncharacterized protein PAC_13806 [Phialocephala subalpina]
MTVLDVINVGCAILQTSAEVAPFVKKYMSKKDSRKMSSKRGSLQATVETDDEEELTSVTPRRESAREDGLGLGEMKDLMRTLQAQSQAVQAHSEMISQLVLEKGQGGSDRLSSISEDLKMPSTSFLDDQTRRMSLETSLRDFSFAPVDLPPSRAPSFSMPSPSVPSSPAISLSSISSFAPSDQDRRTSFGSPRSSASSFSLSSPTFSSSSCATSVSSASSISTLKKDRRVSFGSQTPRASSTQSTGSKKRMSVEMSLEKALSAPLPNKYQSPRRASMSRTVMTPVPEQPPRTRPEVFIEKALSFPMPNKYRNRSTISTSTSPPGAISSSRFPPVVHQARTLSPPTANQNLLSAPEFIGSRSQPRALSIAIPNQSPRRAPEATSFIPEAIPSSRLRPVIHQERALSFPPPNQYTYQSLGPPSSPRTSPLPMPNPRSRMDIGPRASSFSSTTQHRHLSLQPPSNVESPLRLSDIPPREQWRRSLKSPTSTAIVKPQGYFSNGSNASVNESVSSSPRSSATSLPENTPSCQALVPFFPLKPIADSFHSILSLDVLYKLQQHLNNVSIQQLVHHASIWSYSQTLDQLLHPDNLALKGDTAIDRSYLSRTVRSYLYDLSCDIATSSSPAKSQFGQGENKEGLGFELWMFLLRFVMSIGVEILRDAPRQYADPTGLKEVESRYEIVREILGVLEEQEV